MHHLNVNLEFFGARQLMDIYTKSYKTWFKK